MSPEQIAQLLRVLADELSQESPRVFKRDHPGIVPVPIRANAGTVWGVDVSAGALPMNGALTGVMCAIVTEKISVIDLYACPKCPSLKK